MKVKKCNTCLQTKSVEQFIPTPSKNGFSAKCRECNTARERDLRNKRVPDKVCPGCKETRKKEMFEKGMRKCNFCKQKTRRFDRRKEPNLGTLSETNYKLKHKAKLSLEDLKDIEKEKLNNGYTWINEQREFGKVRVLRKTSN